MVSAINIALSGLNAAETQLNVSANNTANQLTKSYVPQKVNQVTLSGGGVQANVSADTSGASGTNQLPSVDPNQEVVNQQIASYDFQANLKTIQVANDAPAKPSGHQKLGEFSLAAFVLN